jgi:hypothetical protein
VILMSHIERSLLLAAVRLLQRVAAGEDVRAAATHFVGGVEIGPSGELDDAGKPIDRVYLKPP